MTYHIWSYQININKNIENTKIKVSYIGLIIAFRIAICVSGLFETHGIIMRRSERSLSII